MAKLLYLVFRAGELKAVLGGLTAIGICTLLMLIVLKVWETISLINEEEFVVEALKKFIKWVKPLSFLTLAMLINSFVPSTKELIILFGVDKTEKIIIENKEKIGKLGQKSYKLLEKKLDKYLEEEEL